MGYCNEAIYIEAAKLVDSGAEDFSCVAVRQAALHTHRMDLQMIMYCVNFYASAMCPRKIGWLIVRDVTRAVGGTHHKQEARNFRVLLLCMMATLVKEEGLDGIL